ncbi:MAG: secretin N-terminal domain-containing protein [Candidatus Omnitrophota bacterium]
MKKIKSGIRFAGILLLTFSWAVFCLMPGNAWAQAPAAIAGESEEDQAILQADAEAEVFTLDLNEADILDALKIIASKSSMNIITTPEVVGTITLKLVDVTWDEALESVLDISNLGYQKRGNIITVGSNEKIAFLRKQESTLKTEVFNLKYLDAQLTQATLQQLLSPRGKIAVLQTKNEGGWEFAGGKGESLGKQKRVTGDDAGLRSNVLVVTDIPEVIEKMKEVVKKVDVRPSQVLIETKIIEVKKNKLKDMGIDWATGSSGAEVSDITQSAISSNGEVKSSVGGHMATSLTAPYGFAPLGGTATNPVTVTHPFNLGPEVVFKKLTGTQFEVMAHALEQSAQSNILSAPRILALNNQEVAMWHGPK